MATLFRHIITYLAVVLIVVTTGGIGLVQHYCSCEEGVRFVLNAPKVVPPEEDADMCCQTGNTETIESCCATLPTQSQDNGEHQCHPGEGCCSEHYSFYKTDQFNLTGTPADLLENPSDRAIELQDPCLEQQDGISLMNQVSDRSPPGTFGRSLLIRIHQLKTDHLIS